MKIALSGLIALFILLAGCAAQRAPGSSTAPTLAPTVFQAPIGELEHTFTRLVQGVNSTGAPPGSMVLLVGLRRPDGTPIDLRQFHDANMQIFVRVDGGVKIPGIMGGFISPTSEEFAVGFIVPEGVKTYTLEREGNPSLEIVPEEYKF